MMMMPGDGRCWRRLLLCVSWFHHCLLHRHRHLLRAWSWYCVRWRRRGPIVQVRAQLIQKRVNRRSGSSRTGSSIRATVAIGLRVILLIVIISRITQVIQQRVKLGHIAPRRVRSAITNVICPIIVKIATPSGITRVGHSRTACVLHWDHFLLERA